MLSLQRVTNRLIPRYILMTVVVLCGAAAGASQAPAASRPEPPTRPRSILLVSIDSLRADHMPFSGYPRMTTPFLSELIERQGAMVYPRATAVAPSCHPSHAALLSGLYPQQVGVTACGEDLTVKPSDLEVPEDVEALVRKQESLRRSPAPLRRDGEGGAVMNWMVIPEGTPTLATFFRSQGYRTGGFASIWTIQRRFGYGQGFEVYEDDMPEYYGPRALTWLLRDTFRSQRRKPGETTLAQATSFLDQVSDEDPFFMFFHLADTHTPYAGPAELGFDEESKADFDAIYDTWRARYTDAMLGPAMRRMSRDGEFMLDAYDRSIRHADNLLRRLFQELEARGRLQDTVVVITSDHGESFGQHPAGAGGRPFFEHSVHVWEETQHIPFIVWDPASVEPPRTVEANVSQVDVVPTLLAATGHDVSEFSDRVMPGQDVRSLPDEARTVFFLTFGRGKPGLLKALSLDHPNFIGFRSGDTKFFMDQRRLLAGAEGTCHLYDLKSDPDEMRNLCADPGERDRAAWYREIVINWWERSVAAPGRVQATN
ncbi:MAG: sulfatase [Candidatus Polarisedimenticolia bacterium]